MNDDKKLQPNKAFPTMPHEHERKELRIVKQAVAKAFLSSGKVDLELTSELEQQMEKWIKWIYRNEQKDWRLIKEQDNPF